MSNYRFDNLVLHICSSSSKPPHTIRLAKLLWAFDKGAYLQLGHKLTGCEYLRKKFGPVPKDNKDLLCLMRDRGLIDLKQTPKDEYPEVTYRAMRPADLTCFTKEEKNFVESVTPEIIHLSTGELIRQSHDLTWALTPDNSVIPFETYLSDIKMDYAEKQKYRELIEEAEYEYADD